MPLRRVKRSSGTCCRSGATPELTGRPITLLRGNGRSTLTSWGRDVLSGKYLVPFLLGCGHNWTIRVPASEDSRVLFCAEISGTISGIRHGPYRVGLYRPVRVSVQIPCLDHKYFRQNSDKHSPEKQNNGTKSSVFFIQH